MSVTRTFTVTVANPGSGNKYYIDSVLQDTVTLGETGTYKFDQADSSNSGHPLVFYQESDKTTGYSTGVTTNGTPGSSGAYTQIAVDENTPNILYYQCSSHGYMGNHVTSIGNKVNSNLVTIGDVTVGSNTDAPLNYFYVVYGERKDIDKLELEIVDPEYAD